MDRIFEKDAERFDAEVKEQDDYYRKSGRCPDCGCYMLGETCDNGCN